MHSFTIICIILQWFNSTLCCFLFCFFLHLCSIRRKDLCQQIYQHTCFLCMSKAGDTLFDGWHVSWLMCVFAFVNCCCITRAISVVFSSVLFNFLIQIPHVAGALGLPSQFTRIVQVVFLTGSLIKNPLCTIGRLVVFSGFLYL